MTTNNQHTPGPWIYDSGHFYSSAQLGPDGMTAESPIACMHSGREENYSANARLIAAAPDLLHELQNMVAQFGSGDGYDQTNTADIEAIDSAKAAIAKATIPSA